MTAAVKTNGIWVGSEKVKSPAKSAICPICRLNVVYYDLFSAEGSTTRVGVFLDGEETPSDEYTVTMSKANSRINSIVKSYDFPDVSKVAGVHTMVIKTGTKTGVEATVWKWTSPSFEVIIPPTLA
jgi:hypothetical protein